MSFLILVIILSIIYFFLPDDSKKQLKDNLLNFLNPDVQKPASVTVTDVPQQLVLLFQSLAACSTLVENVTGLRIRFVDIPNLTTLATVLETLNKGNAPLAEDVKILLHGFEGTDPFNAFLYVFNNVYDDIRKVQEDNLNLPLEFWTMSTIRCSCGSITQLDKERHLAASIKLPTASNNGSVNVPDIIENYFNEPIEFFECDQENCKDPQVKNTLKMESPPETICFRLDSLYWNGRGDKLMKNKFLTDPVIKLHANLFRRMHKNEQNSNQCASYKLRSLITLSDFKGEAHFKCIKQHNQQWFQMENNEVAFSNLSHSDAPYMLFYELID